MPNLGLLGIIISDESFYEAAQDGVQVSIDFPTKVIKVGEKRFGFQLSQMERELFEHGGITSAFRKFGKQLFERMTAPKNLGSVKEISLEDDGKAAKAHEKLRW